MRTAKLTYRRVTVVDGRLKEETGVLLDNRARFQSRLQNHVIFHKYMDRVLEQAEEFHEIREIIARYDTLTATHMVPTSGVVGLLVWSGPVPD